MVNTVAVLLLLCSLFCDKEHLIKLPLVFNDSITVIKIRIEVTYPKHSHFKNHFYCHFMVKKTYTA